MITFHPDAERKMDTEILLLVCDFAEWLEGRFPTGVDIDVRITHLQRLSGGHTGLYSPVPDASKPSFRTKHGVVEGGRYFIYRNRKYQEVFDAVPQLITRATIYVATKPKAGHRGITEILGTVGHEYRHHLQWWACEKSDCNEAARWGREQVRLFLQERA